VHAVRREHATNQSERAVSGRRGVAPAAAWTTCDEKGDCVHVIAGEHVTNSLERASGEQAARCGASRYLDYL
jgi:hypothetical protein